MTQADIPTAPPKRRRAPYRKAGKAVWTLIRQRYLAGESAPALADIFNVTQYAIRRRISREGWSKQAAAEAAAEAVIAAAEPAPLALVGVVLATEDAATGPRAAARAALDQAVRMMRGGRMKSAAEAARVADLVGRAALRLEEETVEAVDSEARFEAVRRKVLGWVAEAGAAPPPLGEELGEVVRPLHHPSDGPVVGSPSPILPPPPWGEE